MPLGNPLGIGLYLTVHPLSHPNTDKFFETFKMLQISLVSYINFGQVGTLQLLYLKELKHHMAKAIGNRLGNALTLLSLNGALKSFILKICMFLCEV